jgi:hypothetical protein
VLTVLIISSFLLGVVTSGAICVYALRPTFRKSRIWTSVVAFGILGLLVPLGYIVVGSIRNEGAGTLSFVEWLWPTSIMLMAGEKGDPPAGVLIVFGAAVLSNVGVHGFLGLIVGGTWEWIRQATTGPR